MLDDVTFPSDRFGLFQNQFEDTDMKLWSNSSNEAVFITLSPDYYAHIDVLDAQKLASAKQFIEKLKKTNPEEYQRLVKQTGDWTKQQEKQIVNNSFYKNRNKIILSDYAYRFDHFEVEMHLIYYRVLYEKNKKNLDPSYFESEIKTQCLNYLKETREKHPQAYQTYMRQKRKWLLAIEFMVSTGYNYHNNLSNEEKFKKAEKDLGYEIYGVLEQAFVWASNKIKAIATKEKEEAAEFITKSYEKTNTYDDKLKAAKNEIATYEKEDLEKYRDLMEKTRSWTTRKTVDQYTASYIDNCVTSYQEKEVPQSIANQESIENYKKNDIKKYYQIMAEARASVGADKWDQQVKDRTKNVQDWVAEYIKVDFEQAKKNRKSHLELINDAFAQTEILEQKLAMFMLQRNTAIDPGKLIGGNAISASNDKKAREIIEKYKLTKLEVYKDLVKRAGWDEDYQNKWNSEDIAYRKECNTPFQPTEAGKIINEEKFAALSIAMCPLEAFMQSAFDGHTVIGEFSTAKEKLVWSYAMKCVSYKSDAINIITFLNEVYACFQSKSKTNDKKIIMHLVNARGLKETGTHRGEAWKVGTCQITASFVKEDTSLREKDSPQYDSGKEMVRAHYK